MNGQLVDGGPFWSMSNEAYHRGPGLSRSFLHSLLVRTPLHAKWDKDHPSPPTESMDFGTACHTAILEPAMYDSTVVVSDVSRRTDSGKRMREQYESQGLIVLKPEQHERVEDMRNAVFAHPVASVLLKHGVPEMSLFAVEPLWGYTLKTRPDWLCPQNVVVDYKTTDDASPDGFRHSTRKFGYDMQAAVAERVFSLKKIPLKGFIFVVQEKVPPYAIACYHADEEYLRRGRAKLDRSLEIYHQCVETGVWPGYPEYLMPATMKRERPIIQEI